MELMEKMKLVELLRPQDARKPAGALQPFGEQWRDEREVLRRNGWVVECESPLEIRAESGFAVGEAAKIVLRWLQERESEGEGEEDWD